MSEKEEILCRFCFGVITNNYDVLDEVIKAIFDVLLLETYLGVIENPVICTGCKEKAMEILNFKARLIVTEKKILSVVIDKQDSKVKLKDVQDDNDLYSTSEDSLTRCRFCMSHSEKKFVSMDDLMSIPIFKALVPLLLPEMDIHKTKNVVICTLCQHLLESYFTFAQTCLRTEDKINTYYRARTIRRNGKVKLSSIRQYFTGKRTAVSQSMSEINEIEFVAVKIETPFVDNDQPTSRTRLHNCNSCSFQTKYKSSLKRHTVWHQNDSGVKVYKCTWSQTCRYKTMRKRCLEKHLLVHNSPTGFPTYTCESCGYETKKKGHFRSHEMIHKDSFEVEIHKCPLCTYETRYQRNIRSHMLTHTDPSELQMYRCKSRPYETKEKRNLKMHSVNRHVAAASKTEIHKCLLCPFKTRHKRSLKTHTLIHIDSSEVVKFRCASCPYESVYKCNLQKHLSVHKRGLNAKQYKCGVCLYETTSKKDLKVHTLLHQSP